MIRIVFNGKEYSSREHMPEEVRRAYDEAVALRDSGSADSTASLMLAFAAGFVLVFAIALMFALGGGPSHLPGRLAIAVAAMLVLGWIDTMATRLARRREPQGAESPGYRRFIVGSAGAFAVAAVLLFGLALYLT